MKIEGRSDAQLRAAFDKKFMKIWGMGDRDECSTKHIWWGCILIMAGGRYSMDQSKPQPMDYRDPGKPYPREDTDEAWAEWDSPEAWAEWDKRQGPRLEAVWNSIYDAAHEMGAERFARVIRVTFSLWSKKFSRKPRGNRNTERNIF